MSDHDLFPLATRRRAWELVRLGRLLAWSPRFAAVLPLSLLDVWEAHVMPLALVRA